MKHIYPFHCLRAYVFMYYIDLNYNHYLYIIGKKENKSRMIEFLNNKLCIFLQANASSAGRFKVKRGMQNIHELNQMIEFNGEPEVDNWDGDECNQLKGTDGLMFPPYRTKKDTIWAFSWGLCRAVGLQYLQRTRYKGIGLKQFTTYFPDLRNHPEQQCYCRDPPDGCPPEGVLDLATCLGGPLFGKIPPFLALFFLLKVILANLISGTKPHFLEVDPKVQQTIKGLSPDPKKHQLTADFDLVDSIFESK